MTHAISRPQSVNPPERCCPLMTHAISRPQSVTPLQGAAPWWHMPSAGHSQLTPWKMLPSDDKCHQQATVSYPPPWKVLPPVTHAISRPQSVNPLKGAAPWWHLPSAGHSQLTPLKGAAPWWHMPSAGHSQLPPPPPPWKVLPPDDTCHQQATVS